MEDKWYKLYTFLVNLYFTILFLRLEVLFFFYKEAPHQE